MEKILLKLVKRRRVESILKTSLRYISYHTIYEYLTVKDYNEYEKKYRFNVVKKKLVIFF